MRKRNHRLKRIISMFLVWIMTIQLTIPASVYAQDTEYIIATEEADAPAESLDVEADASGEEIREEEITADEEEPQTDVVIETEETEVRQELLIDAGDSDSLTGDGEAEESTEDMEAVQSADEEALAVREETELVIAENSTQVLKLEQDTTLTGITLGTDSSLTVDTQDYNFTVAGAITGQGTLTLKGNNIHTQGISVRNLIVEEADIDAASSGNSENTNMIQAADNLTVQDSKISNAALLGYGEETTGRKTLKFDGPGNILHNITTVGTTENGKAIVTLEGADTFSTTSNTNFVCDYMLTYRYQDRELTAEEDWPVSYRVKYTGSMTPASGKIIGYHVAGTEEASDSYQSSDTVSLPSYTEEGYTWTGWTTDAESADAPLQELPQTSFGTVTLTAVLTARKVTVITDLDYTPDASSNDDYEQLSRESTEDSSWGEVVSLQEPSRFGYEFSGWKVVKSTEEDDTTIYRNSYTVALPDAEQQENESYVIRLEAQWTAKKFPFRLFLKDADTAQMKVTVGDTTYDSLSVFATQYDGVGVRWNAVSSQLELPDIYYGETLQAYASRIGLAEMPRLEDTRAEETKKEFAGWTTPGGNYVSGTSTFSLEDILDNKSDSTKLTDYENMIRSTPVFLTSGWGTAEYTLTVDRADGWDLLINGEVQSWDTVSAGTALAMKVAAGSEVTLRCSALSPKNFSRWFFTEGFLPQETTYVSGTRYLSYVTAMPYQNVTATYGSDLSSGYVDLAKGDITFEEQVALSSGRKVNGFWYPEQMKKESYTASDGRTVTVNALSPAMKAENGEYFYIWDTSDGFHVTSEGKATANPLTVVNTINVSLLDCNLTATTAYESKAVGTMFDDVQLESVSGGNTGTTMAKTLSGKNLREYGNIVIDTAKNNHYTVTLTVEGDKNVIADITTDGFHDATQYNGTIDLKAASVKNVTLGTIFGDFAVKVTGLTVNSYQKDAAFDYLVYTAANGNPYLYSSTVNAKEKRIFTYARDIRLYGSSKLSIRELKCYYEGVRLYETAYAHIYGDIYSNRHGLSLYGNSSAVIDGNVLTTVQDNYSSGAIDTTGYLIVKGTVFDASNMTLKQGTVICNVFQVGESCTISGSATLVTNMITSNLYNSIDYVADYGACKPGINTSYNVGNLGTASSNEDNYPFTVYSGNAETVKTYAISENAKIYLLGYYKTSGVNYDLSVTAMTEENPVKKYIDVCLDADGELSSSAEVDTDGLTSQITESSKSASECIMLGNSTYTSASVSPRYVSISGGTIYAGGNMTLFNDTTVSGGTIYCNGSFGSKSDLNITGGTITADTVGNVYNLTNEFADHTKSWKKTDISGGIIHAKRIGARDGYGTKNVDQRSLVELTGGTIDDNAEIRKDIYINYIYDTAVFPDDINSFAELQKNVRLNNKWTNSSLGAWSTEGISSIAAPKLSDTEEGNWIYGSLAGEKITGIDTGATLLPKSDETVSITEKDRLKIYAAREQYSLTEMYGGNKYNLSGTGTNGETLNWNFTGNPRTDLSDMSVKTVQQAKVAAGSAITLTLTDASDAGHTVIWYQDAGGLYHNALEGCSWNGASITFKMPNGDCDIYVTDDSYALPLDLSTRGLSFTADGFITEFASADGDGKLTAENAENFFTYSGNYKIVQSDIGVNDITASDGNYPSLSSKYGVKTGNRIRFASDFNNVDGNKSQITVTRVFQECEAAQFGTILENSSDKTTGAKVCLTLDGKAALFRFQIPEAAALTIKGKTGADTDRIYFNRTTSNTPAENLTIAGNNEGNPGDFTLEGLTLNFITGYSGQLMRTLNESNRAGSLTLKDCKMQKSWGDSTGLARNIEKILIDNCDITINTNDGYTTMLFDGCGNVTIQNKSKLAWNNIGSTATGGYPVDYGIIGNLTINDSEVSTTYDPMNTTGTYKINPGTETQAAKVILQNNAAFTADSLAYFRELEVNSGASLNIKQQTNGSEDTWLLCKAITVDGGQIEADNIIVSGFYEHVNSSSSSYTANYKTDLDARILAKKNMVDGESYQGLKLTSGSVTAHNFVGGDQNGKIEVAGGTLTASAIGTSGYLYGFIRQLPANKVDYVYRYPILDYSNYTQKATVTVSGEGVIQVKDDGYLGGMRSNVQIQGGMVELGNGAILGMTEAQKQELTSFYAARGDSITNHVQDNCSIYASAGTICLESEDNNTTGSISVPYGTVTLSDSAQAKLTNILAEGGSITIKETASGYANPYTGNESSQYKSDTVGIWVTDTLSAQTVTIMDRAQVYAENAYAVVDTSADGTTVGKLTVTKAGLYAASYGEKGVSRGDKDKDYNDKSNTSDQTVFGTRLVSVTYVLNPQGILTEADAQEAVNESLTSYTVTESAQSLSLTDAVCQGYEFKGWYETADCEGSPASSVNTSLANDLTLYAKWEKIQVTFRIMMDSKSSGYYEESEFIGNSNWIKGTENYVSAGKVTLSYGEKVLSTDGVNLFNYNTNTLGVTELELQAEDYSGSKVINADTIVTKELAEYYKTQAAKDSDAVLILHVKNVQRRIAAIAFSLNKKNGKPTDAAFKNSSSSLLQVNISVDKSLGAVPELADTSVTSGHSQGLIQPVATGYTFIGWNTSQDATKDSAEGWIDKDTVLKENTTIYAVWQANTYLIVFDAGEGKWVTSDQSEPAVGESEVKTLNYYWVYDTPVSEDNSFWFKSEDNNKYMTEMPYAWKEGYVFDHNLGWNYTYQENGVTKTEIVKSTDELSRLAVKGLNTALGDPDGTPKQTALTLTASYTPVTVTYQLNGGKWTDSQSADEAQPASGDALAGYVKEESVTENTGIDKLAVTISENQTNYCVVSTTAEGYRTNQKYAENDYRNVLSRKGYTFYGWYRSQEDADTAVNTDAFNGPVSVGTAPRFSDITLYAAWKANDYKLNINNKSDMRYSYTTFSNESAVTVDVTSGEPINDNNWPSRNMANAWKIWNTESGSGTSTQDGVRYFLGATFAALDPGANTLNGQSVYTAYVKAIKAMQDSETLYQGTSGTSEGTVFELPGDEEYRTAIGKTDVTIPDYPNDSMIDMYAVYREQSLVFVERYVDTAGMVQEEIKQTVSWDAWSDYPNRYSVSNKIQAQGYSLVGWYVNTMSAEETKRYPDSEADYQQNLPGYQKEAEDNGTYDIMVYTVFASNLKRSVELEAKSDPTSTVYAVDSYTFPASMQKGQLNLTVTPGADTGLQLVSRNSMDEHAYDVTWSDGGTEYTSDSAVAIQVTLSQNNGTSVTKDLTLDGTLDFEDMQIGAGDKMILTLYHSRVMTQEKEYQFTLRTNFVNNVNQDNTLKNQYVDNLVTVQLHPSMYEVNYTLNLPEAVYNLTIQKTNGTEDWGGFTKPSENISLITLSKKMAYGSDLLQLPSVEGYTAGDWKDGRNGSTDAGYTKLELPVTAGDKGAVAVNASYEAKTYSLQADSEVLKNWKITYSNGVSDSNSKELTDSGASVKYHSAVVFEPKDTANADPAEFVTLTMTDPESNVSGSTVSDLLSEYATETSGSYAFSMPAQAIAGTYVTTETLYLEEGTISITESGYTQDKAEGPVTRIWRGTYNILQNAENLAQTATGNRLILAGDFSGRTIALGNLNISTDHSIQIGADTGVNASNTVVELMLAYKNDSSTVTAKNILVSDGAEVTLEGAVSNQDDSRSRIALTPGLATDAIGGANAKNVTVKNCTVAVTERSNASTAYSGAWIGGTQVSTVNLDNVVLEAGTASHMAGPVLTRGTSVTITDSQIGTSDANLTDPLYAENQLMINNSKIYLNMQDNIQNQSVSSPIGTQADGTTTITDSTVKITSSSSGKVSDRYSGTMKLTDTATDVTIDGTQIVEVGNGAINITAAAYTQDGKEHASQPSRTAYLLLEEGSMPANAPDLTITSGPKGKVEIGQPKAVGQMVTIGNLEICDSMELVLSGSLRVTGTASVGIAENAAKKTVTVSATDSTGISFTGTDAVFRAANGAVYQQTNGTLTSASDMGDGTLDISLENVTATVKNLYAKDLSVTGGTITALGESSDSGNAAGSVGSKPADGEVTQVQINGNAVISSANIGALGTYDKTFTTVTAEDVTLNGTLVQDQYRLAYDTGSEVSDTGTLAKTVRTETKDDVVTVLPENGVPDKITQGNSRFEIWYLNMTQTDSAGGTVSNVRKALTTDMTLPAGLKERTTLAANTIHLASQKDVKDNDDGTKTLTVHAWLTPTGTATGKKGRIFRTFTDGNASVNTSSNGCWTAQVTSTGTAIEDRDYQVSFSAALPEGTMLTLTEPGSSTGVGTYYYYYQVNNSGTTSVKFTEFTKMGGTGHYHSEMEEEIPESETFLLAADFSGTKTGSRMDNTVKFELLPTTEDTQDAITLAQISYSLSEVTEAVLTADASIVSITQMPYDADRLNGKTLFLKAQLSSTNTSVAKIPFGMTAQWNGKAGTWISRDTVVFEAGAAATSGNWKMEGLPNGTYSVIWSLVYGSSVSDNIAGNDISNKETVIYTEQHEEPSLKVTPGTENRILSAGAEHTVICDYETTGDKIEVIAEKQSSLGSYESVSSGITVTDSETAGKKQKVLTFASELPEGTYRICFSMDQASQEDNVYVTFIVKEAS